MPRRKIASHSHFKPRIKGKNDTSCNYEQGKWVCDCSFFQTRGVCVHTMALEMVLNGMVDKAELSS
jgi:hypothetical protein